MIAAALVLLGCTTEKVVVVPEKQYNDAKTQAAAQKTRQDLQGDKTWQQLMQNTKGNTQ
jgi:hypothetical protein